MKDHLIRPHGGRLISLIVDNEHRDTIKEKSASWPSWNLTSRQICDLELLMNGAFSPLEGFMSETQYNRVCTEMRLSTDTLWPIPITLDVDEEFASKVDTGDLIALRDPEGVMLAKMQVEDKWCPDRKIEAASVYGTEDPCHEGVRFLLNDSGNWYIGGKIAGLQDPVHFDFLPLRLSPKEVRKEFSKFGWRKIVAHHTSEIIHRAQYEMTMDLIRKYDAKLLLHPSACLNRPGDMDHYTRIRCYQSLSVYYPHDSVRLYLIPLSFRMAGPREALLHAIIRKNYGCSHFIVVPHHAEPQKPSSGKRYYHPYAAQKLADEYKDEIGVEMATSSNFVYVKQKDSYIPETEVKKGTQVSRITDSDLRNRLSRCTQLPSWFTFPEIEHQLLRSYPPRNRQGFTLFFTGLSGSGKSTIANSFIAKFLETANRPVTLLDGDIVRKILSSELGFSREDRNINIMRIGFVANEITKSGGIALCAPIAPYESVRKQVRKLIEQNGGFILIYVSTSIEICEKRDRKGLYAKAKAGIIKGFTGISDPYEVPTNPDLTIDSSKLSPYEAACEIILHLEDAGYIEKENSI